MRCHAGHDCPLTIYGYGMENSDRLKVTSQLCAALLKFCERVESTSWLVLALESDDKGVRWSG